MKINRNPGGERHFFAGAFVAAVLYTLAAGLYGTTIGFGVAVIGTGIIGWLVEVSQRAWGWGTYSNEDIQHTAIGGLVGTLVIGVAQGWTG